MFWWGREADIITRYRKRRRRRRRREGPVDVVFFCDGREIVVDEIVRWL